VSKHESLSSDFAEGSIEEPGANLLPDNVVVRSGKTEALLSSPLLNLITSPVPVSEKALKEVRDNACQKCARAPRITKMAKSKVVASDRKVRIQCRTAGKPKPLVTWFKDGVRLQINDRKKVKDIKQGSRLELRHVKIEDSGTYQCQARNAFGQTKLHNATLTVTLTPNPVHSRMCEQQGFCLNGGTCFQMTSLIKQQYCVCAHNYFGSRCEELNTGQNSLLVLQKDGTYGKKKRSPTIRHRRHKLLQNYLNDVETDIADVI